MRWLPVGRKLAAVVRELVEVAAHGLRDAMAATRQSARLLIEFRVDAMISSRNLRNTRTR
jgi:hypothetical protein